ncbi:hypothetical protein D3C73_757280 [compost metagenome]
MQSEPDHLLGRIENGDAAILQLARVLGFEQQVQAVERHVRQALLERLDVHAQTQGAPGIRHTVAVAGIDGGELFQQIRIEIGVPLEAFVGNRFQRPGGKAPGQHAGGRHHHVITAAAGEQFGLQYFRRVKGVVAHMDAGFLLEPLQGFGGDVIGPTVQIDHLVLGLGRCGHGKE